MDIGYLPCMPLAHGRFIFLMYSADSWQLDMAYEIRNGALEGTVSWRFIPDRLIVTIGSLH
jgi:hypothetical protein